MVPRVRMYFTGTASTAKGKSDARRIATLLDAKRVTYESVDLCLEPDRKEELEGVSTSVLPVLMVDGTILGGFDDVQEMEDEGELDSWLRHERTRRVQGEGGKKRGVDAFLDGGGHARTSG